MGAADNKAELVTGLCEWALKPPHAACPPTLKPPHDACHPPLKPPHAACHSTPTHPPTDGKGIGKRSAAEWRRVARSEPFYPPIMKPQCAVIKSTLGHWVRGG